MKQIITRSRAAAYRAMARAALRADSSLTTRLNRYNQHMAKARHLEAQLFDAGTVTAGGAA